MYFAVICRDKPGAVEVRDAHIDAHRAHVNRFADIIDLSGPLLAEDGVTRQGQLYVLSTDDRARVQSFVDDDPFTLAELFAGVTIEVFSPIVRGGARQTKI